MRLVARSTLVAFWDKHPETKPVLTRWERMVRESAWATMAEIQAAFPRANVLNGERVRFEVHHNDYRMVAAFHLRRQIAYVKFIGTHKEYDAVDALAVSLF